MYPNLSTQSTHTQRWGVEEAAGYTRHLLEPQQRFMTFRHVCDIASRNPHLGGWQKWFEPHKFSKWALPVS